MAAQPFRFLVTGVVFFYVTRKFKEIKVEGNLVEQIAVNHYKYITRMKEARQLYQHIAD